MKIAELYLFGGAVVLATTAGSIDLWIATWQRTKASAVRRVGMFIAAMCLGMTFGMQQAIPETPVSSHRIGILELLSTLIFLLLAIDPKTPTSKTAFVIYMMMAAWGIVSGYCLL